MKKVEATIQHFKLDAVKKALLEKGVEGMTVTEVHNIGEETRTITYRGTDEIIDSIPKVRVETIVPDRIGRGSHRCDLSACPHRQYR